MLITSREATAKAAVMARLMYLVALFFLVGHGAVLTAIVTDPPKRRPQLPPPLPPRRQ